MGKIGLAVTPGRSKHRLCNNRSEQDEEKGFYRSISTKGESWEKRNSYISGGTGPHYYQVIAASPTVAEHRLSNGCLCPYDPRWRQDRLCKRSTTAEASIVITMRFGSILTDHGDHLLVGSQTQGYTKHLTMGKAGDISPTCLSPNFIERPSIIANRFTISLEGHKTWEPFMVRRVRLHIEGVRNQDWYVPLGADGYHVAFDPEEPYIMYMEFQSR